VYIVDEIFGGWLFIECLCVVVFNKVDVFEVVDFVEMVWFDFEVCGFIVYIVSVVIY